MNPFRYHITLRLRHPNIDPEQISAALQEKPCVAWRAGQERRTPKGDLLTGVYPSTYWCGHTIKGEGMDLAERIESALDRLEEKKVFLAEFAASGGEIEFYIGWFTGDDNTAAIFDCKLLRRLAALQIDLGLDVYGGPDRGKKTTH